MDFCLKLRNATGKVTRNLPWNCQKSAFKPSGFGFIRSSWIGPPSVLLIGSLGPSSWVPSEKRTPGSPTTIHGGSGLWRSQGLLVRQVWLVGPPDLSDLQSHSLCLSISLSVWCLSGGGQMENREEERRKKEKRRRRERRGGCVRVSGMGER
jgi:hypothetical protein